MCEKIAKYSKLTCIYRKKVVTLQAHFVDWRIMLFSEVIGQENIKQQLRTAVREGRVPHALLFTGKQGVGKLQMALAFTQYLACPNRTETDACGTCPTCLQYRKLQHPDLGFAYPVIKPEGASSAPVADDYGKEWRELVLEKTYFDLDDWYDKMGAGNKQGLIYERESSEILRKLSLKAFGDGYKTMIIWLPEKMNETCANKLLKIIEEPPEKTLFILVSEQPQRLLATILSRVQQVTFERLSEDVVLAALREVNEDLSVSDAIDLAHTANGSYLAALKQMQSRGESSQFFTWFVELMRNAWLVGQRQQYDSLLALRKWSQDIAGAGREKQKAFLEYAIGQVRENYISNFAQPEIVYQSKEERDFSVKFARFINDTNVERLIGQLELALKQIEQNGNAKMIFFDFCLQLIVLIK